MDDDSTQPLEPGKAEEKAPTPSYEQVQKKAAAYLIQVGQILEGRKGGEGISDVNDLAALINNIESLRKHQNMNGNLEIVSRIILDNLEMCSRAEIEKALGYVPSKSDLAVSAGEYLRSLQ